MSDLVGRLRAEAETLREEVRQLREALTPTVDYPAEWKLTRSEGQLLSHLMTGSGVKRFESLMMALYGAGWLADPSVLSVFVCKLRSKLPERRWIENVRGEGYRLSPAGRAAIRTYLDLSDEETSDMAREPNKAPIRRQINIAIDERVHTRLTAMAGDAGVPLSTYARTLFEAAYAARCGETGDHDLDATVAAALILTASGMDAEQIARALGTTEIVALRIVDAWREAAGR